MDPRNKLKIPSELSLAAFLSGGLTVAPNPPYRGGFCQIRRGELYTKLDLSNAYNQFVLSEESQKLTTIRTTRGLFRYTGLVYELASAPAVFQRAMVTLLLGVDGVSIWLDDVCVTGPDRNTHLARLREVFARLKDAGLKLQEEALAVIYAVLCALALVYRYQCGAGLADGASGSSYFIRTVYRVYIQQDACNNPESSAPTWVTLTDPETMFIFLIVILILSIFSCVAAIILITVVAVEREAREVCAAAWAHAGLACAVLAVDLTLAVLMGIDHYHLADAMNDSVPGILINYRLEVLRMGSLLLMFVSLKGCVAHVVNAVLVVVLAVYAIRLQNLPRSDEHPIHKMGAINAYELQKREDAWQQQQDAESTFRRGQHSNPGFESNEEPRRAPRSPARAMPLTPMVPMSDYSNRDYDRSDSWQHSAGSRPFSYVEEARRAPAPAPQWRRDPWPPGPPAPPMPAPDYSPPSRRLKSAMKPNYM